MFDPTLTIPTEPIELRDKTRKTLEESAVRGGEVVRDATFLAYFLWRRWGAELREAGMVRKEFVAVARGYSQEIRLWVVGERPWEHCASGLAGRVRRRLGYRGSAGGTKMSEKPQLVSTGVSK